MKKTRGKSRFKGVHWFKPLQKWRAQIIVNYRQITLGTFVVEEDAARAYDAAAHKHFGEFARPNFNPTPSIQIKTASDGDDED